MMARMDKASGIFAGLLSHNSRFVTLKVSELFFHSPVHAGDIVEFHAVVGRQGHTSLGVALEVLVYNPASNARREVTSGVFVMVAVNDAGEPEPIRWKPDMLTLALS